MNRHFEKWSSSGLSKLAYCKKNGLCYHKFNYHHKRHSFDSDPGFTLLEPESINIDRIELHLPNGCYFSVSENSSISTLQKLISVCSV